MNWYNYVGSDPVNLIDPTGMQSAGGESLPSLTCPAGSSPSCIESFNAKHQGKVGDPGPMLEMALTLGTVGTGTIVVTGVKLAPKLGFWASIKKLLGSGPIKLFA